MKTEIVTDASSNQVCKRISDYIFEYSEDGKETRVIDIRKFKKETVEDTLNSYGYSLYKNTGELFINDAYEDSNMIIAECLFELDIVEDKV